MKPNLIRIFAALSIIFIFGSCSKEEQESTAESFYFKAKFNGVEKKFATTSFASKYVVDDKQVIAIVASIGNETSSIALWSVDGQFKSGNTFGINSPGCNTDNSLEYTSNQLISHDATSWGSVCLNGSVTEKFNCKITEVTATYIRGTFEADLYRRETSMPKQMAVTDGSFYVRFK